MKKEFFLCTTWLCACLVAASGNFYFIIIKYFIGDRLFHLYKTLFLLIYLSFKTVHDLHPIQTDLLNLNPNPLNLGQKLFFRILLSFLICLG